MAPRSDAPASAAFGRFLVSPHRRELLADGQPVRLGGRAFDVLMALIEARGAVVGKDALMARVWPDRVVEENNLQSQISALRAAFGADRELIRTVSGRGYQFTGEIRTGPTDVVQEAPARVLAPETPRPTNLPALLSELIGRDEELTEILRLAAAHRLVTLTGTGGIGKTQLALAAARGLLPQFADGVWLIELARLSDPGLIPATVVTAAGLELATSADSPEDVAEALSGKQLLLVLDNCEHVIDAAAVTAEALLRASPTIQVIATSREPLKIEGEWVYPVPPLAVPADGTGAADEPLQYGAVRLFCDRVRAAEPHFAPERRSIATIAAMCRRLDGIPLAIELAAARTATLGIEESAARLDNRFALLIGGRRTAMPRHQTLRATLDWSYELLPEPERCLLRRLAVFPGGVTLEASIAVMRGTGHAASSVMEGLTNLVLKSLVMRDESAASGRWRLLETIRAYALDQLIEHGEADDAARCHAEFFCDFFGSPRTGSQLEPSAEAVARFVGDIDNVRAALDWAFSPAGDSSLGVALTTAAVPLWMHLSLVEECRYRVEQALASPEQREDRDQRREMQLSEALGAALMYTRGATPQTRAAFARAFDIADSLDDTDYRLRALWGLWVDRMNDGAVSDAMRLAQRFSLLASSSADPIALPVGERTMGFALHFLGDQANARLHIERMFNGYVPELHDRPIIRFQFDPWLTAQMRLAVILWLQGYPDQATRAVESCIGDALSIGHSVTLCNAFAQGACVVALQTGDLDVAERWVAILLDHAERAGLRFWQRDARCFQGVLLIRRGDVAEGVHALRAALDEFSAAMSHTRYDAFIAELGEGLGRLGDVPGGLAAIDPALDRIEQTGGRWYIAELLRIRGELVLLQGGTSAVGKAEDHFRQALDWARRQGALSWELRAATSLARLLRDQGRSADGLALLQPVYDRFTEGFGTADLKAANALLDALR